MSLLSDSLKKSSINLDNISKSLSSTQRSTSSANNSVSNISTTIANNTKIKRQLFTTSSIIQARREEATKRKELEDQRESSQISTSPSAGLSFTSRSEKGPFGRLLGFLGFITAGWIVENLPTWIFMGKEFISRVYKFGNSMSNMVGNIYSITNSFGSLLQNSLYSILTLDFDEFSEGSVSKSFNELNAAVETLGVNITDTFKLFTTPLTQSLDTGEQAPGLGEDRPETMFPSPTEGVTTSGYGTKEQQALLKTIRFAEGTVGSTGYSMFFGDKSGQAKYGDLTKLSANEVEKLVTKFLQDPQSKYGSGRSAAVGAYQIIDITAKARAVGMDMNRKFDQSFQDEMALRLAASRGVTADVLKREGLSDAVIKKLSPEWASFPGNTYGQPTKRVQDLKSTYQQSLSSQSQQQTRQVPVGNITPVITSRYGDSRGSRSHGGTDLAVNEGTPLRAISDGVIVDSDFESGWGNFLVMKDNLGIYHLYGHMQSGYKRGGPVKKGEVIGKVGTTGRTTGPHLHWESGTSWDGYQLGGKFDPLNKYSRYAPFNTKPETTSSAEISSPAKPEQPSAITPERKGSEVVIVDNTQPQQPQVLTPPPPQTQTSTPTISQFKLLNNFIKNKLLLDLAYL